MKPSVSVIIPAYNSSKFIEQTVDSVLAQTYKNYEIIVIDDGSTDDTKRILQPYINKKQIRYIYQENKKQAAAKNTGFKHAKGELIAFLDHDDLWHFKKLELQIPLFNDEKVGLVYGGVVEYDFNNNKVIGKTNFEDFYKGHIFDKLFEYNFIPSSTTIIRKKCLEKTGGMINDLFGVDDYYLWLMISHEFKVDFVPKILLKWRWRDNNNMSSNLMFMLKQDIKLFRILSKKLNISSSRLNKRIRKLYSYRYFSMGYRYRKINKFKSLYYYSRSLVYGFSPLKLKAIIKLITPFYYKDKLTY